MRDGVLCTVISRDVLTFALLMRGFLYALKLLNVINLYEMSYYKE